MVRITISFIFAVMLLSAVAFPRTVNAGSFTANQLKEFCQSKEGAPGALVCLGYFIGFNDAAEHGGKICAKGAVKHDISLFLKKVREKPVRLLLPATLVVHQILANAAPCK